MKTTRILATSIAALLLASPVPAATFTWDGGSGVFSGIYTAENWNPDALPVSDLVNTTLEFGGLVRLTPIFDSAFSANGITFLNTAGPFALGGSAITIGMNGFINQDAQVQIVGNNVTLGTATSTFDASSGGLTFNGTVALGANALAVNGAQATAFTGAVTGTGTITKNDAGAFNISATASAIGASLNLTAGTTTLVATGTAQTFSGTSTVTVSGPGIFAMNESLTLDGAQLTRGPMGGLTLAAGKTLTVQGGGGAVLTGSFSNNTASTITVTGVGSTLSTSVSLELAGGSTTNVQAGGSVSAFSYLNVGSQSSGTLLVDGMGSSASANAVSYWGDGASATVTFSNNATGSFPVLEIAATTGSSANVQILSGADITNNNGLRLAESNAAGVTGTLLVSGAGSTWAQTDGLIVIGGASGSVATLTVSNGGTFTSGTGQTTVNATGTVAIAGGTFNANGDMTVNGQLTRADTGVFSLAAGKTLTIQNGGDAVITGGFSHNTASTITVTGTGSTFSATSLEIVGGSTANALAGGSVSANFYLDVGFASSGTLVVDGTGSSASAGTLSYWGSGASATVTFSNNATGSFLSLEMARSADGTANVQILSGADITNTGSLQLGNATAAGAIGTLLVSGAGSTWQQTDNLTTIGAASDSVATLTVGAGAAFTSTTGGMTINPTGTVNVSGGTLSLGGLVSSSGTLNFNSGTILLTNSGMNLTVGTGGLLGVNLTLLSNRALTIGGTTTVDAMRTLTLDGGSFTTGALVNNGVLDFQRGVLGITGAGGFNIGSGALGALVTLGTGTSLQVTNTTTVEAFSALTLDGGAFTTGALVNNGTLDFQRGTLAVTGAGGFNIGTGGLGSNVTLGAGANLQVTNTATVASGALLRVNGGSFSGGSLTNDGTIDHADGTLAFTGTLTNAAAGRVFIGGVASPAGAIANAGRITLQNGVGFLGGAGAITNTGLISGDGTIAKPVTNGAAGELRAEAGKTLLLTGANGTNTGKVNLQSGTIEFSQALTNSSTGTIQGRGTANFAGGLTNQGAMNFSAGTTDVFGNVNMTGGAGGSARVIASGGGTTTFYNGFIHNGAEVRASANSTVVFFGAVTGSGSFAGAGTVSLEGSYNPGGSPAIVTQTIATWNYTSSSVQFMEIFGTLPGPNHPGPEDGYDKLIFTGAGNPHVNWNGTLQIDLGNNFMPQLGMIFDLFDFDNTRDTGAFHTLTVNDPGSLLAPGLGFDYSQLYVDGTVSVVPEPGSALLLVLGGVSLALRRRRRR